MINCRLTISSRGRGWQNNAVLPATMEEAEGGVRINYALEGDPCCLVLQSGRAEQLRKGSVNIKMSFVQGQKTACIIGDSNLRGGYEVFTKKLSCTIKPQGATAVIQYLSGDDKEDIKVTIRCIPHTIYRS